MSLVRWVDNLAPRQAESLEEVLERRKIIGKKEREREWPLQNNLAKT